MSRIQLITLISLGMLLGACQKSEISAQSTPTGASITPVSTVLPTVPPSATTAPPEFQQTNIQKPLQKSQPVVGQPIDCDGIPDDCVIGDGSLPNTENTNSQGFYEQSMKSLEQLTQGCEEKTKIDSYFTYSVCTISGRPVKASEFLTELGDGLNIWFEKGQVKAVQRTHNGETFFFENGKLTVKFEDYGEEMRETVSNQERSEAEQLAKTAYQKIFQVFDIR
ncbi:hypothetical protein [Nodularia sp. UHCC 0506]|uniref:hypothetical protein n=1 Tax=Nodularia sp. UHCC 0506 TaxID=3110243 RepID=UPI002B1E9240|nr:hypothetical protein [Nodularia sp. UHCC 0506]MEA5513221.1 hypothetical protein [Nodularia sp. UHCC 0506]